MQGGISVKIGTSQPTGGEDINIGSNGTGHIQRQFLRYVLQNIFGMLGMSAYVLADTIFIARSAGTNGITALNLVLPIYNLIYAFGAMTGVGSATRYKILAAQKNPESRHFFTNALLCTTLIGLPFMLLGVLNPALVLHIMGADAEITAAGLSYTRIFMCFAPFFMWNQVFNAFVRNDDDPTLAMIATFSSSVFNVIFDYVLMFPLGLGMAGAALATAFSPIVGIGICLLHFRKKENHIRFQLQLPSLHRFLISARLGFSSFIGELSNGVTTVVFNALILALAGNVGVAAYGVIANINIVAIAIFNGVAQGSQPLMSDAHGRADRHAVKQLLVYAAATAEILAVFMLLLLNLFPTPISALFNSEGNAEMTAYAVRGIRLYFIGLLFASFNIAASGFLSATDRAIEAFVASILRGLLGIILLAPLLSAVLGMTGVWLAVPATELLCSLLIGWFLRKK